VLNSSRIADNNANNMFVTLNIIAPKVPRNRPNTQINVKVIKGKIIVKYNRIDMDYFDLLNIAFCFIYFLYFTGN
jgi:hypothetical protein